MNERINMRNEEAAMCRRVQKLKRRVGGHVINNVDFNIPRIKYLGFTTWRFHSDHENISLRFVIEFYVFMDIYLRTEDVNMYICVVK